MTSPRTLLARLAGALDLDYIRREAETAGVGELLSKILPAAPKS
jgi:hypothetical protein